MVISLRLLSEVEKDARVINRGKTGEAADFCKGPPGIGNLERIVWTATRLFSWQLAQFQADPEGACCLDDAASSAMKAVATLRAALLFSGAFNHCRDSGCPRQKDKKRRFVESNKALLLAAGIERIAWSCRSAGKGIGQAGR